MKHMLITSAKNMEFERSNFLSSREICDIVFDKFSVCIETKDIDPFPQFRLLLSDLCNDINPGGITESLHAQLEHAEKKLIDAKQLYFQANIIYSSLDEVLKAFESKCLKQTPSPAELKVYSAVRKQLSYGKICNYLSSSGERQDFLGFTKDFILSEIDPINEKILEERLIPEIQRVIFQQSKSVLLYHGQEIHDDMVLSKILQLPSVLVSEEQTLTEQQRQICKDKKLIIKQIGHYYEYMLDAIKAMKDLIELRQKSIGFQTTMAQFYAAKYEAIFLKARILELEILNDTYTPETVPALQLIRNDLIKHKTEVEHELEEKMNLLKSYEAVGSTFSSLVEEYTQLTKAIENEKWALEELKKSESTSVL